MFTQAEALALLPYIGMVICFCLGVIAGQLR